MAKFSSVFAGLFSSPDGTWMPLRHLRRISATAAWMLFFGFVIYGVTVSGLAKDLGVLQVLVGGIGFGPVSYGLFLWIGDRKPN